MAKSIAKSRNKWFEEDYEEFDRTFISKNKKKNDTVEVKRTKNRTFTKMKHMSSDELMEFYDKEEEIY